VGLRCHSGAAGLSYYAMSNHSYLIHLATKQPGLSRLELRLLDRDLADAGVHLPWSSLVRADSETRVLVLRVVRDVLDAA